MAFGYAACSLYATTIVLHEHQQHLARLPICSAISTALMEKRDSAFHFCEQQIQSRDSEYNWLFRAATVAVDRRWQRYTLLHSIIPWEWISERAGDWHTALAFEILSYIILGGLFAFAIAYFLVYPYLELRRQHGILQKREEREKSEQTKMQVKFFKILNFATLPSTIPLSSRESSSPLSSTTIIRRRLGKQRLMMSSSPRDEDEDEQQAYHNEE